MIHILAQTKNSKLHLDLPVERLCMTNIAWYWVDFESANQDEISLLSEYFKFDQLTIEDCLEHLERPKVDYYGEYNFFVLHALDPDTLEPVEVDLYVGKNYVVSFHKSKLQEMDNVRQKMLESDFTGEKGHNYIAYLIFDKIVDGYFPTVYRIEDCLNDIDISITNSRIHNLIDRVFEIRTDLLKLRRTVNSMKELLYRILNSHHLEEFRGDEHYFHDIHDHLLKLSDIIESNRELTSDVRDNYLSINSHRMNKIMTILTIISSIFIPLTFIVGIYGMNFDYMPELRWKYGYFTVMGFMALIAISMVIWFHRKGWFDTRK